MFIANATYSSQKYGVKKLGICTTKEEVHAWDNRNDGLLRAHFEAPIADAILRVAATETLPAEFILLDVPYTLLRYNARKEERFYNKYRKNYVVRKSYIAKDADIYVCSERCRCTACFSEFGFESLENVCGVVRLRDDPSRTVEIDVQHCTHCNNYFIDQESLIAYEREYGLLRITKHHITGNENESWARTSVTYNPDSILSRNGYSTKLYTRDRRAILVKMMKSGIKKAEIKDLLSRFITQRSKNCPNAAVAWEADLQFVNEYNLDNEPIVRFEQS